MNRDRSISISLAFAALIAAGTCIRARKLTMHYAFGPPLIAGTLAVVLFHA